MRPSESAVALINRATLEIFQPLLDTVTRAPGHMIFSSLDRLHIDDDLARDVHAEIGCTSRHMGGVGARHQGLGRRAAGIDASAAEQVALDDGNVSPAIDKTLCKRWARLAGSDDDCVIALHWLPRHFTAYAEEVCYSAASMISDRGSCRTTPSCESNSPFQGAWSSARMVFAYPASQRMRMLEGLKSTSLVWFSFSSCGASKRTTCMVV